MPHLRLLMRLFTKPITVFLFMDLVKTFQKNFDDFLRFIVCQQSDKNLTWEQQIDLVCRNLSRKLTLMKLLSKYVNQNSLKQYYNSYVLPVFDSGCVVWGNTTNANLTRLVKLQKRAARMIFKADFMTPSEQLFKELKWLPFPKRVQYHTCLMVCKSITGQAPEYISSMLTYGPKLWNSLPADIRNSTSINRFKRELKRYLQLLKCVKILLYK